MVGARSMHWREVQTKYCWENLKERALGGPRRRWKADIRLHNTEIWWQLWTECI
jgi:hypothetical protein